MIDAREDDMIREPNEMRKLAWRRRLPLVAGQQPATRDERVAVREYVAWLDGAGSLVHPTAIAIGVLVGALLLAETAIAVLIAAIAFVVALLVTFVTRERMRQHLTTDTATSGPMEAQ